MQAEDDQKRKEWYPQLYEEERSRDSIILQQFSLGMIVIGVLISAIIVAQKPVCIIVISAIGIAFLIILTHYIRHARKDKMWAREQRKEIEKRWKLPVRKDRPSHKSAIIWIEAFFILIIVLWSIYLICILCSLGEFCII